MTDDKKPPYLKIWALFFIYPFIVAVFIQFIALPMFFPKAESPYAKGMIHGLDSVAFHTLAMQLVKKINDNGWSAWTIRPRGQVFDMGMSPQGISGVAAAIYAATNIYEPWTLIPLNAFLHATAGLALMLTFMYFTSDWRYAFWGATLFVFLPTPAMWYAQMHKDAFTILGAFLFILGWTIFSREDTWKTWRYPIFGAAAICYGAMITWIMRPYLVQLLVMNSVIAYAALGVKMHRKRLHGEMKMRHFILFAFVVGITILIASKYTKEGLQVQDASTHVEQEIKFALLEPKKEDNSAKDLTAAIQKLTEEIAKAPKPAEVAKAPELAKAPEPTKTIEDMIKEIKLDLLAMELSQKQELLAMKLSQKQESLAMKQSLDNQVGDLRSAVSQDFTKLLNEFSQIKQAVFFSGWKTSWWLPSFFDNRLYTMAQLRDNFTREQAKGKSSTGIDLDISFHSGMDVVMYLPRAMEISFLAPFPSEWAKTGGYLGAISEIMKKAAAIEMCIIYILLIFLVIAMREWKTDYAVWIILLFSSSSMIISTLMFCNIGTIHRMRYGYITLICGFGLVWALGNREKIKRFLHSALIGTGDKENSLTASEGK